MDKTSVAPELGTDPARTVTDIVAVIRKLRAGKVGKKWTRAQRQGLSDWLAKTLRGEVRRLVAGMKGVA